MPPRIIVGCHMINRYFLRSREVFTSTARGNLPIGSVWQCWMGCPAVGELESESVTDGLGTRDRVPVWLRPMREECTGTGIFYGVMEPVL